MSVADELPGDLAVTVVPNWNLRSDLAECLDSLLRVTYRPHEILVVDNGSTDGSAELVLDRYPSVHLLRLPDNAGYASALNAGIEYSLAHDAAYVFALNNDTVVRPNALSVLVDALRSHPSIGIVSPKILYYSHPEWLYSLGDRRYRLLPMPRGFGYRKRDAPQYRGVLQFDYVTGCAMLIRSSLFRQIGVFDTSFEMYYEDADFCRRVRDRGIGVACVADAVILHKASVSAKKAESRIVRIRARNRVRFYRRYRHGPHPGLTYLTLWGLAILSTLRDLGRGRSHLVAPFWKGFLAGWRERPEGPSHQAAGQEGSSAARVE